MIPSRLLPAGVLIALAPAVVIAVVLALAGLPLWLAILLALLGGMATAVLIARSAPARALKGLDPHTATETSEPRVFNLLDGLVFAHGLEHPEVAIVDEVAPNAAIIAGHGAPTLVLTRGLLDHLGRMQLEAVLAQLLTTARDTDLSARTVAATYASLMPAAGLRSWVMGLASESDGDVRADFAAVDLTRYPPALAGAYEHLMGRSTTVQGVTDTHAHLWLAAPVSGQEIASRWSIPDRVSALQER